MQSKKIVVFASGGGSNFEALAKHCAAGYINGRIVLLVVSKPCIGAADKAKKYNIPVFAEGHTDLLEELKLLKPDLICLCGYLKKISPAILKLCPVMNIHPALLPKYGGKGMYGVNVHKAVLAAGEVKTGVTIHFVDEEYDKGTIIMQEEVPVLEGDTPQTLAKRVLEAEHKIYPLCVKRFCEGETL